MKKFVIPFVCGVFVLAIAFGTGCGGGGGGSSSDGGSTGATIRAEAALAASPSTPIDPVNIQVGETIAFQVVSYDASNVRTILSSTGWTTNDNGNQAGILQTDGTFSATTSSGVTIYTATGTANAKTYSLGYRVKPVQAQVTGTVMDSNGLTAAGVKVVFYNAAGVESSRVTTQYNGTFRASVPATATMFNFDTASLPTSRYFRSFTFQAKRYSALIKSCSAPLPALTNGTTTALGIITVDASHTNGVLNPPPPPPNGCPTT